MTTETAILISGVVVGGVQLVKLFGVEQKWGILSALVLSVVACVLYGVSNEPVWARTLIWPYFSAVIVVASSAVGIHSATKNTKELVTGTGNGTVNTSRFQKGGDA